MAHEISTSEWGRLYAKAWLDPEFAEWLSTDPASAAKDFLGLDADTAVRVHHIPDRPADLTADQLEDISSGESGSLLAGYSC